MGPSEGFPLSQLRRKDFAVAKILIIIVAVAAAVVAKELCISSILSSVDTRRW